MEPRHARCLFPHAATWWGALGSSQWWRGAAAPSHSPGVSHASDDPALHRNFEIRATYDLAANGWVAQIAEHNRSEYPGLLVAAPAPDPPEREPRSPHAVGQ